MNAATFSYAVVRTQKRWLRPSVVTRSLPRSHESALALFERSALPRGSSVQLVRAFPDGTDLPIATRAAS